MDNNVVVDDSFLSFTKSKGETQKRSKAFFWGIIIAVLTLAVTCIGVAVAVKSYNLSKETYNHRYDADANAAGECSYVFEANGKNSGIASFTVSAGKLTYGYYQESGVSNTEYTLYYKGTVNSNYRKLKNLTVYSNRNYTGDFYMAKNRYSTRYDVKCAKNNNMGTKSVFKFNWGVE